MTLTSDHQPAEPGARVDQLCTLFAEILGADDVGPDDSFFALSGDSIAVMKLVTRAREAGLDISIADVFAGRTPRALAAAVGATSAPAVTGPTEAARAQAELDSLSPDELAEIEADLRGSR